MNEEISVDLIQAASREVKICVEDDLCSYSWLRHILNGYVPVGADFDLFEKQVISDLLSSGIEIGQTFQTVRDKRDHLGFRAW